MNSDQTQALNQIDTYADRSYKYGFVTDLESDRPAKGLNEDTIKFISQKKEEPEWMLNWRLQAFERWKKMAEPSW
ncbi:MAG: FeS cluster assembly protein SufB, partial [Alphaproteobacteria bacterium MarineAlpha6_Bin1]